METNGILRWLSVLALALLLLAGGITLTASIDAPVEAASAAPLESVLQALAVEATEKLQATEHTRAIVLEMVRLHRRRASERWRQRLADAIYEESVAAGVDPLMVASIVATESSFKSQIVSRSGAIGLMQLRPFVARDVAKRRHVEWHGRQTLNSPDLNVRLGILYYQELVDSFAGDQRIALTAYNYGPTRVRRQMTSGTYSGSAYADEIIDLYSLMRTKRAGAMQT